MGRYRRGSPSCYGARELEQIALARERKPDGEERSTREPVLGGNLPVVGFDDGAGNRKPDTHALRLGGEKRIEDFLEVAGRYTGTGVVKLCAIFLDKSGRRRPNDQHDVGWTASVKRP